jgi:hypothetical protein
VAGLAAILALPPYGRARDAEKAVAFTGPHQQPHLKEENL